MGKMNFVQVAWASKSDLMSNIVYQHQLLNGFEKVHQVDILYTDFSMAFDRVNNNLQLAKPEHSVLVKNHWIGFTAF